MNRSYAFAFTAAHSFPPHFRSRVLSRPCFRFLCSPIRTFLARVVPAVLVACSLLATHSARSERRAELQGPLDKAAIQALLDELDDIDIMRSIAPLKLTGDQIDKLITSISDAKTKYDKKIADLSGATVGQMSDEIHKRHKSAIGGVAASQDFDAKVKRLMADFYSRRETINGDNIVAMTTECGKILTAEQQKIAAQLEKDTLVKVGKKLDPANKDSQYFNLYVVDLFIGYPRIVSLLKEIKSASG